MQTKIRAAARILALPWLCSLMWLAGASAEEVVTDPPGRVARLSHTEGEVTLAPAGTEEWAEAILNRPLTSGDRLWTETGARAELQIASAAVYLDERTSFGFVELDDDVMQMSLTGGAATIRVRRLSESESIQVETPNVAISLREPGEYHIEVDAQADRTVVKTRHGEAEVFANEQTHLVRADEQGVFSGLQQLTAQIEPLGGRTSFENWANDRERREVESESAQYVSRDVVGYTDLDDHGDWLHEPEYGYVWRPRHVSYTWVPYRDGRWVWVSPWGWTWVDRSPWGFAPFHYGRWAHVRNRWCWVPGPRHYRPVYAPALVGWVGGPHVSVSVSFGSGIGWFPLGPREIYYPGYRHSPRYIRHVNVSNTIIVNNTYITNIYAGRHRNFDYRYGRDPHAVTAVGRSHFISGRPVLGRVLHVDERELRSWRHDPRPPAIAPNRESVLAGSVRRAPPTALVNRGDASSRWSANRVRFDAERREIEANGGRPIGRTHLYTGNPKEHRGDFHRGSARAHTAGAAAARASSANRDSVAHSYTRSDRIESLPAQESSNRVRAGTDRTDASQSIQHRAVEDRVRESRSSDSPPRIEQRPFTMREPNSGARTHGFAPEPRARQIAPDRSSPSTRAPTQRERYAPPKRVERAAPQRNSSSRSAAPTRSYSAPRSNTTKSSNTSRSSSSRNAGRANVRDR